MLYKTIEDIKEIEHLEFVPSVIVIYYHFSAAQSVLQSYDSIKFLYPDCDMIGCSTDNIVYNHLPFSKNDNSASFILTAFDIKKEAYGIEILDNEFKTSKLYATPVDHTLPYNVFVLATPGQSNQRLITTLHDIYGEDTVFGAISGGNMHNGYEGNSIFCNGEFFQKASLIWFIDQTYYTLKSFAMHTFEPIGFDMRITYAEENTVYQIDNRPALEMVEDIIGTMSNEGISTFDYPFFITEPTYKGYETQTLNSVKSINRTDKSITFFKTVSNGAKIKVSLPIGLKQKNENMKILSESIAECGFVFFCVGIAFKTHWEENESIHLMHLSKTLHQNFMGLHSYGKIASLVPNQPSMLQNQTITAITLTVKDKA